MIELERSMLIGIDPVLSPELLYLIARMGHGDELVLADSNFPSESVGQQVVRADGIAIPQLLEAVLKLFPIDTFVPNPAMVMQRVDQPEEAAPIWGKYQSILNKYVEQPIELLRVERFDFYERARQAFGVIATGETALYGNLILVKGVIT